MRILYEDIRFGLRQMAKNPAFTAIAVLTLALGSGANTAIFSVIDSALLQPLPYPQPRQLVQIFETNRDTLRNNVSGGAFKDWERQSRSFSHLAIFETIRRNLTGRGAPTNMPGLAVSAEFLPVLGIAPMLGRDFVRGEDGTGGNNHVVILGHQFWQEDFGGDPQVVGRSISLDQVPFTIVGILPPRALLEDRAAFLVPEVIDKPGENWSRAGHWRSVIGRMLPGVSAAQVQAELQAVKQRLTSEYPDFKKDWGVAVAPLQAVSTEESRPALLILLATVGLVLLISCVNVSNLLLARGNRRSQEMAVRVALGASTGRLVYQLLIESLLLALAGCLSGWFVAECAVRALTGLLSRMLPLLLQPKLNLQVFLISLGMACGCGILFGILPAWRSSRPSLTGSLKEGANASSSVGVKRSQAILVVSEFAFTLMLLVGAGLLVRSFVHVLRVNPGFRPEQTLSFDLTLPDAKYPKEIQKLQLVKNITQRLAAIPGVASVGSTTALPLGEMGWTEYATRPDQPKRMDYIVSRNFVSPGYFASMGMPVLQGRDITDADNHEKAARVLVVDTNVARDLYPGSDPIGKRILFLGENWEIVGVVPPVHQVAVDRAPLPAVYGPQSYLAAPASIVLRSARPTSQLSAAVRDAISSIDPDQPIANLQTLADAIDQSVSPRRSILMLVVLFAAMATILASIGIYGLISYSTSQRTRELSIRAALGAQPADIIHLVIAGGLKLSVIGVAVGMAASFGLTRFVKSQLYGVSDRDLVVLVGASILLMLVGIVASYLPARSAARADLIAGLRYE